MCEFLSAVRVKGNKGGYKYYYLTTKQTNSERGLALKRRFPGDGELVGHAAIRAYYRFLETKGVNWEQTDFSSPANFPPEIVRDLIAGEFRGLSFPRGLLRPDLESAYWAKVKLLDADYEAKLNLLNADCWAKRKPLDDDYEAKLKLLDADYRTKLKPLDADYEAKLNLLNDDYWAKRKLLNDDYWAKRKLLDADYWDLFLIPENRSEAWR